MWPIATRWTYSSLQRREKAASVTRNMVLAATYLISWSSLSTINTIHTINPRGSGGTTVTLHGRWLQSSMSCDIHHNKRSIVLYIHLGLVCHPSQLDLKNQADLMDQLYPVWRTRQVWLMAGNMCFWPFAHRWTRWPNLSLSPFLPLWTALTLEGRRIDIYNGRCSQVPL